MIPETHSHTKADAARVAEDPPSGEESRFALLAIFFLVGGAQLALGMWLNSRGFLWNDALSRASSALMALYGTDPHLAAIGFVWMPLPTLVEMAWTPLYLLWPGVVSSGFSSTLTTAVAGGSIAALLLYASRKFGLPSYWGWVFALVVSSNPMILLFASNGMSEGVAAPFLIGSVCFLTLFWHTGQRRYVAAASVALALGFASLYQAVPFGGAVFAAMTLGIFLKSETAPSIPQGRWRAVEGLGILFLVPSAYVGLLWVGANWTIMGDPLFFAHSQYSNEGVIEGFQGTRLAARAAGDLPLTIRYIAVRTAPFLIPILALFVVRVLDRRVRNVNTFSLLLLALSVPVGMMLPQTYSGGSFGWLRYFMYPLFVAAGWGLYEIARSHRKKLALGLVLCGWVLAVPAILGLMSNPSTGSDEHYIVKGVREGSNFTQVGFPNDIGANSGVARYVRRNTMPEGNIVAVDAVYGWAIAAQMPREDLGSLLILTPDRRFKAALQNPDKYHVSYLLVPDPSRRSNDLVNDAYPRLWKGDERGFELVKSFPRSNQGWKLYRWTGQKR